MNTKYLISAIVFLIISGLSAYAGTQALHQSGIEVWFATLSVVSFVGFILASMGFADSL